MIWDSILIMTVIDLSVIGMAVIMFGVMRRHNAAAAQLSRTWGPTLIALGISVTAAFYMADLLVMWVLPAIAGQAEAMRFMEYLHLDIRWIMTLVSLALIFSGFSLTLARWHAQERRHDEILRASPAVHFVAKPSGNYGISYVSPGINSQLGYAPEKFTQDSAFWIGHVHPDEQSRVSAAIERVVEKDRSTVEYRFLHADGDYRWLSAEMVLVRDQDSNPVEVVGSWSDITERVDLEREINAVSDRERKVIGRDLHDGLGQELTGISLSLKGLSRNLGSGDNSRHVQAVKRIITMVQNAIGETGRVARRLSPGISAELGLNGALIALAEEVNQYPNVRCFAKCSDQDVVHEVETATHLYRFAQEAINNAVKHSQGQNIELNYGRDGDSVFLEVLDDGVGIQSTPDYVEGLGLRTMRQRARMINGTLQIEARVEGGTRIVLVCSTPINRIHRTAQQAGA